MTPTTAARRPDPADASADASATASADGFAAAIDAHRRDVVLLCYRFLGSLAEAEEAAQETALRAWRGRAAFRGEASVRTWLHRIAARVCLDLLRTRRARRLPPDVVDHPADPADPPAPPETEIAWLEPLPDDIVAGAGGRAGSIDPAARFDLRESVSLAFIAALQVLPPRQRAVLLLRDVLAWTARETADALDMTVPAANSALHRARAAMQATHHRTGREAVASAAPDNPAVRRLLDAYVRAWQSDDVDGLVATMRADVRLAMPPSPSWYEGRAAVEAGMRRWIFGALRPVAGYAVRSTIANGQPAAVFAPADDADHPLGVQVLDVADGRVAAITVFLDGAIAARFA
jgi:RNA polymerase sigma-70 factor (ECF subfamily)